MIETTASWTVLSDNRGHADRLIGGWWPAVDSLLR